MESNQRVASHPMKISGHVAPMARPRDIIESLNKLVCHHLKVNDLKMFIGLVYRKV